MKEGKKEKVDENNADTVNTSKIVQARCSTAARCKKGVGSGREDRKKPYRKFLTDKNAPKRPHSAYVLFLAMQKRPVGRNKGVSRAEENIAVGNKWTMLSDEQKRVEKKEALIKERRRMSRRRKINGETNSDDEVIHKDAQTTVSDPSLHYFFLLRNMNSLKDIKADPAMEVGITGYAFASLLQAEDVVGATQSDGIPIFSSQFLEYNKGKHFLSFAFFVRTVSIVAAYFRVVGIEICCVRIDSNKVSILLHFAALTSVSAQEMALKKLRQRSSSLEEENRLLKENITRLKANIAARKREQHAETDHTQELLRTKEKWASVITGALNGVLISGAPPVSKNIVAYMERLNYLVMEDPQHPVLVKVRAAVSGANFL
uniref:HMG box domain-containing protein n=1 Tax=Ascaris lumbricoides TaxID=6252 RepID=A0A0M3I0V6_ASCLU